MARAPKAFRDMDTTHLICRQTHKWEIQMVESRREGSRQVRVATWLCERCGLDKEIHIDADGFILRRRSGKYPDGYVVEDLRGWGGRTELNRNVRNELYGRYVQGNGSRPKK